MQWKVGRLREKRTDDPGTVSKTFRDSFFGKEKNEEGEGIEKLSKKCQEANGVNVGRKQTGRSSQWKNYGQR